MSAIKCRKRLTKFKITIALLKKFGSKGFFAIVKVIKIQTVSPIFMILCVLCFQRQSLFTFIVLFCFMGRRRNADPIISLF